MIPINLEETYPRQQSLTAASNQFVLRVSEFYGGFPVEQRKVLESTESDHTEELQLMAGRQLRIQLQRDPETFEIQATAYREFNLALVSELTERDLDILCTLAGQESVSLHPIPDVRDLSEQEEAYGREVDELLSILLMITGRATYKGSGKLYVLFDSKQGRYLTEPKKKDVSPETTTDIEQAWCFTEIEIQHAWEVAYKCAWLGIGQFSVRQKDEEEGKSPFYIDKVEPDKLGETVSISPRNSQNSVSKHVSVAIIERLNKSSSDNA